MLLIPKALLRRAASSSETPEIAETGAREVYSMNFVSNNNAKTRVTIVPMMKG